jgi:protocatechuate 3,4-dioxygenase beta subunit
MMNGRFRSRALAMAGSTRRSVVRALAGLPVVAMFGGRAFGQRTPASTEGPYYPSAGARLGDVDNDLVRVAGAVKEAGGEVIVLKGRVLDADRNPVAGARVEIWQCDVNGRYLHPADRGSRPRDPAFQGFGHFVTGADGTYAFRTIKPVPYPGRTPHIHVKVRHNGRELTTQFYIAGHAQNANDFLFSRLSAAEQRVVSMVFSANAEVPEAAVDIVL